MQEFCNIAFLARKENVAIVQYKLKIILADLPHILDQDDKEMTLACEKARVTAAALGWAPRNGALQAHVRTVVLRNCKIILCLGHISSKKRTVERLTVDEWEMEF